MILMLIIPEGVYGTIVGTNDLAMGIAQKKGNEHFIKLDFSTMYRHNLMMEAYKDIAKICQDKRKYAGIHFTEVDLIEKLINEFGYQLITLGRDKNFSDGRFVGLMRRVKT